VSLTGSECQALAAPTNATRVRLLHHCVQVPACSTVVCKYTAQYPQLPSAGWHQVAGSVQYQADKGAYVGVKEAAAAFEVSPDMTSVLLCCRLKRPTVHAIPLAPAHLG
jgi:hypothetical protein